MKSNTLFCAIFLIGFSMENQVKAQIDSPSNSFSNTANQSILSQNSNYIGLPPDYLRNDFLGNNKVLPPETVGSPYLNERFVASTITLNDTISYEESLRYNAFTDEIELSKSEGISALFKRPYLKAEIEGQKFVILDFEKDKGEKGTGYMIELVSDGNTKLYKRVTKVFQEGRQAESSYKANTPPQFLDEEFYFLKTNEKKLAFKIKAKKKYLIEAIGSEDQLKSYIKEKALNLSDEKDLIDLIAFSNSI